MDQTKYKTCDFCKKIIHLKTDKATEINNKYYCDECKAEHKK